MREDFSHFCVDGWETGLRYLTGPRKILSTKWPMMYPCADGSKLWDLALNGWKDATRKSCDQCKHKFTCLMQPADKKVFEHV